MAKQTLIKAKPGGGMKHRAPNNKAVTVAPKKYDLRKHRNVNGAARVLSTKIIERTQRQYQVTKLRAEGYTYKEISDTLGISVQVIQKDIAFCLKLTIHELVETTEESRQLQVQRLDMLTKAHLGNAIEKHTEIVEDRDGTRRVVETPASIEAARLMLDIEKRRSALLALDVPVVKRSETTGIRLYVGINVDDV